jgi:hypothetical protein
MGRPRPCGCEPAGCEVFSMPKDEEDQDEDEDEDEDWEDEDEDEDETY